MNGQVSLSIFLQEIAPRKHTYFVTRQPTHMLLDDASALLLRNVEDRLINMTQQRLAKSIERVEEDISHVPTVSGHRLVYEHIFAALVEIQTEMSQLRTFIEQLPALTPDRGNSGWDRPEGLEAQQ